MYTHTHIYNMRGIGVTKTTSSAFAGGKEGARGALSSPSFSLSLSLSLLSPALNGWHQTAEGGSGYLLSRK